MIKFFRHIRYTLMETEKTGKYLKYAIGEIILVVIGILIALQVNTWNQNRIAKVKEQLLLKELHNEFKSNKSQLDSVLFYHKRAYNSAKKIMSQFPINLKTVNLDSLSYHNFYMQWIYTFNPSQGVTNSLLNSSTYEIISNDTLRNLLIRWNDIAADYQEEEIKAYNNYINHLKPYEKKHMVYGFEPFDSFKDSRLDLSFLETVEFENYVRDRFNDLLDIVNNDYGELDNVYNSIEKIIELSKTANDD